LVGHAIAGAARAMQLWRSGVDIESFGDFKFRSFCATSTAKVLTRHIILLIVNCATQ